MMGTIPKRDDTIYKEIESFEDYELTQCVAYEMAIRNNDTEPVSVEEYEINRYSLEQEQSYKLSDITLYGFYTLATKITDFYPTYIDDTKKIAFNIFKEKPEFQYMDEKLIKHMFHQGKKIHIQNIANDLSYFINNFLMNDNKQFMPQILPLLYGNIKIDRTHLIDMIKHSNLSKPCTLLTFSRPEITLPTLKKTSLDINLGLPLNELIAQITTIKKNYDKDITIVKNPIELVGEELQKADNLVCDTKGKCFDARETLSKQQKLADMFYIYDCLQHGATQRKIQTEIYNYYANKGIETRTMDAKTLKRYKEIAIDYIDNMRYKELATGVKMP